MPLSFFSTPKKPLLRRCQDDQATRMRLKYAPYYHVMDSQQGTRVTIEGREMIMLSSNDYLGLTFHPKVVEAACTAVRRWGSSPTGARISNGSRSYHTELEQRLADFLGREACHVHAAGYLSCMSGLATFAQKGDLVLADKNLHSCMWDGIRLSLATVERFSHNNPQDLRDILQAVPADQAKLVAVEGVYSMEGHICRMPEIARLAEEHKAFLLVDDAHGFGVLGRQGRGTVDHFGLNGSVDLLCGSLSKALASTGGFVAGSAEVIEYLRTHSKQTVFSAALAPAQAAAAMAALEVLQTEPQHMERLWSNTRRYKEMLRGLGLDTWESETPAVPIVLGSKERAYFFWKALMEEGVFTVLSTAPAVPPGKDLIRTAISALHTEEQLERIAGAMQRAMRRL